MPKSLLAGIAFVAASGLLAPAAAHAMTVPHPDRQPAAGYMQLAKKKAKKRSKSWGGDCKHTITTSVRKCGNGPLTPP
jgi:hypothetical protein